MTDTPALVTRLRSFADELSKYQDTYSHEEACLREAIDVLEAACAQHLDGQAEQVLAQLRSALLAQRNQSTDYLGEPDEFCWCAYNSGLAEEHSPECLQAKAVVAFAGSSPEPEKLR